MSLRIRVSCLSTLATPQMETERRDSPFIHDLSCTAEPRSSNDMRHLPIHSGRATKVKIKQHSNSHTLLHFSDLIKSFSLRSLSGAGVLFAFSAYTSRTTISFPNYHKSWSPFFFPCIKPIYQLSRKPSSLADIWYRHLTNATSTNDGTTNA